MIVAVVQDGALSHAHVPHDRAEVAPISPVPNEVTERRSKAPSRAHRTAIGTSAVAAGAQQSRQIGGYALAARAVHRVITTSARLPWPRPEPAIGSPSPGGRHAPNRSSRAPVPGGVSHWVRLRSVPVFVVTHQTCGRLVWRRRAVHLGQRRCQERGGGRQRQSQSPLECPRRRPPARSMTITFGRLASTRCGHVPGGGVGDGHCVGLVGCST